MIHLPRACRGRTAVRFPANSSHMCCVELALDKLLCTHLGSKGFGDMGFLHSLPQWQRLYHAATDCVIWLCACMRYWPGHGLVYVCPLLWVCTIFNAIELGSIYFHQLLYFTTFLDKLNSAHIGKIFARWHLAIAITSIAETKITLS